MRKILTIAMLLTATTAASAWNDWNEGPLGPAISEPVVDYYAGDVTFRKSQRQPLISEPRVDKYGRNIIYIEPDRSQYGPLGPVISEPRY